MHVESFVSVHSWQNGTRCRYGVKVLWCHSHLVWLDFEASIPTCTCFHEGKRFVTVSVAFFFPFCKREESGRRGRGKDAWSTFLFT